MLFFWNIKEKIGMTRGEWRKWQQEQVEQKQCQEALRQAQQNFDYADAEHIDDAIYALNKVKPIIRSTAAKVRFMDCVRRNNAAM